MDYEGTIIEESLANTSVLNGVKVLKTKVEKVGEGHRTPWIKTWTLHKVSIPETRAEDFSYRIAESIDPHHAHAWYADFKNETGHYVIFLNKVFFLDRRNEKGYDEVIRYGTELGIPPSQMNPIKKYLLT